jgi:hypothetical protein
MAPFLLAGWFVAFQVRGRPRLGPWIALGAVAVALAQAATCVAVFATVGQRATPGGYGMPLEHPLRAARAARELGQPAVVASPGDDPIYDSWPAVLGASLGTVPHRFVDGRQNALVPAGGGSLIATEGAEVALDLYERLGALHDRQTIAARAGETGFVVAKIDVPARLDLTPAPEAARQLSHGVEIVGYAVEGQLAPGERVTWLLAWRVTRSPDAPEQDYHVFNHLMDGAGRRVAQADGGTLPTRDWIAGDLVVSAFELAIPGDASAGPYTMRVGMYTYPEMQVQMVLDAEARPIADAVLLGPLLADAAR